MNYLQIQNESTVKLKKTPVKDFLLKVLENQGKDKWEVSVLFTGDAFIPGEKVVTTLPGGDKVLAADSLSRILKMAEGRELYPGHELRKTKSTI